MQYNALITGDVFALVSPKPSPLFRKTYDGKADEVWGGDLRGKIITRATQTVFRPDQEVQRIEPSSITGKADR